MFIDPDKCNLLNQLEGAEVVISSSWGYDNGRTEKILKDCGLTLPIIGYTKKLHYQYEWACRGNEIEAWLQDAFDGKGTMFGGIWTDCDYEYVIIDDDKDMLLGQVEHFVHVKNLTGITQEDINKAKKILNL